MKGIGASEAASEFAQICAILSDHGSRVREKDPKTRSDPWVAVSFDRGSGKGSHARLYYGGLFTTLEGPQAGNRPGLLSAMLH